MKKVLLIGKTPPPIGGVTIHCERLQHWLKGHVTVKFYDLRNFRLRNFLSELRKANVAHLHSSSVYLRFLFAVLSKTFRYKSIITLHGDLGRYKWVKNQIDYCALILCSIPILINEKSFIRSLKLNSKSLLIPAYLPPVQNESIPSDIQIKLKELSMQFELYATNAFDFALDSKGKEIYGISQLLVLFNGFPKRRLVIADPSGNYYLEMLKKQPQIVDSAFWITRPVSFFSLLSHCDGFIRNTTTDGDSLSVHESLANNKPTFATSVVDRPEGTIVYDNLDQLSTLLDDDWSSVNSDFDPSRVINQIIDTYQS